MTVGIYESQRSKSTQGRSCSYTQDARTAKASSKPPKSRQNVWGLQKFLPRVRFTKRNKKIFE